MTPGQEALREAMRLEQARIYGTTLRDKTEVQPTASVDPRPTGRELDAAVAYWNRRGQSVASIAFRLGCTRGDVRASLNRLEGAA